MTYTAFLKLFAIYKYINKFKWYKLRAMYNELTKYIMHKMVVRS